MPSFTWNDSLRAKGCHVRGLCRASVSGRATSSGPCQSVGQFRFQVERRAPTLTTETMHGSVSRGTTRLGTCQTVKQCSFHVERRGCRLRAEEMRWSRLSRNKDLARSSRKRCAILFLVERPVTATARMDILVAFSLKQRGPHAWPGPGPASHVLVSRETAAQTSLVSVGRITYCVEQDSGSACCTPRVQHSALEALLTNGALPWRAVPKCGNKHRVPRETDPVSTRAKIEHRQACRCLTTLSGLLCLVCLPCWPAGPAYPGTLVTVARWVIGTGLPPEPKQRSGEQFEGRGLTPHPVALKGRSTPMSPRSSCLTAPSTRRDASPVRYHAATDRQPPRGSLWRPWRARRLASRAAPRLVQASELAAWLGTRQGSPG